MPLVLTSIFSALVLTYALSRLMLRLLVAIPNPTVRLILAHLLSWLTVAVGFIKAYFVSFAYWQTAVLVPPQLVWFLLDTLRGLGSPLPVQGTSTRTSGSR